MFFEKMTYWNNYSGIRRRPMWITPSCRPVGVAKGYPHLSPADL